MGWNPPGAMSWSCRCTAPWPLWPLPAPSGCCGWRPPRRCCATACRCRRSSNGVAWWKCWVRYDEFGCGGCSMSIFVCVFKYIYILHYIYIYYIIYIYTYFNIYAVYIYICVCMWLGGRRRPHHHYGSKATEFDWLFRFRFHMLEVHQILGMWIKHVPSE